MKMQTKFGWVSLAASMLLAATQSGAAITVPGADGSDGVFAPTGDTVIDLAEAATGTWSSPSPAAGKGVYDPEKWAVVFKYESVNIPADVTVTFSNHPAGAPVVWLVSGDVEIIGKVSLDGSDGSAVDEPRRLSAPGPGGYPGGLAMKSNSRGGGGFGPGGGYSPEQESDFAGTGGAYSQDGFVDDRVNFTFSRVYGTAALTSLLGGSGGAGGQQSRNDDFGAAGGGGGGGGFLLAAIGTVSLQGEISADGGRGQADCCGFESGGGGSGGGIRLIADEVAGSGVLNAIGKGSARGGGGRIRVEANSISLTRVGEPIFSAGFPGETAELWPDSGSPKIGLASLGGVPVPTDPNANLTNFAAADVPLATADSVQLVIHTENVDPTAEVQVRVTPVVGVNDDYPATYVSTDGNDVSTWHVDLPIGQGFSAIQARVVTP